MLPFSSDKVYMAENQEDIIYYLIFHENSQKTEH